MAAQGPFLLRLVPPSKSSAAGVGLLVCFMLLATRCRCFTVAASRLGGSTGSLSRLRTSLVGGGKGGTLAPERGVGATELLSPEGTLLEMEKAHVTLSDRDLGTSGRCIIVGDVHGCCDELEELLQKCEYRRGEDTVVLAGDLVNKGPKSLEAVRLAAREGFRAVRGNHDDYALAARLRVGRFAGKAALPEQLRWVDDLTRDEVRWLADLPYTLSLPSLGAVVVHAGLVPGVPLEAQLPGDMYTMRTLIRPEDTAAAAAPMDRVRAPIASDREVGGKPAREAWAAAWRGPEHVYFGHDAKRGLQQEKWATGLDTGCLYGRQLTACVLPERRLVSVPAQRAYVQPGDKSPAAQ